MNKLLLSIVTAMVLLPALAWGHAALITNPAGQFTPRGLGAAEKTGPCGGQPRGTSPTVLTVGQQVNVVWRETIKHPGYYILSISPANDQNFAVIPGANMILNNAVPAPTNHNMMITVPNTPCTACTLQMIQVMTETNPPTNYYSCTDIVIQPVGGPTPTPTPAPTPAAPQPPKPKCN